MFTSRQSFIYIPPHSLRLATGHTLSSNLRRNPAPHHDLTLDKNLFLHPFICNRTTRFVRASLSFDASFIFGLQDKSFNMKQSSLDLITVLSRCVKALLNIKCAPPQRMPTEILVGATSSDASLTAQHDFKYLLKSISGHNLLHRPQPKI